MKKIIIAVVLLLPLVAQASMRCGSRIVDEGSLVAEVLAACGEPDYISRPPPDPYRRGYSPDTETWTYDFGPQKLLNLVRFRDGRVSDFDTDGYGFPPNSGGHCDANRIVDGLSQYRLVRLCGQPFTKRAQNLLLPLEETRGGGHEIVLPYGYPYAQRRNHAYTPVLREEWVYNFGSRTAMRRVILEDGEVTYVEAIDRGFDR